MPTPASYPVPGASAKNQIESSVSKKDSDTGREKKEQKRRIGGLQRKKKIIGFRR